VNPRLFHTPFAADGSEEMICTCSYDGIRDVLAMRFEGMRRLNLVEAKQLTAAVVLSLAFDFQAEAEVASDQWFGVSVFAAGRRLLVACDDPADGLLYLWLCLVYPEPSRVLRPFGTREDFERAEREAAPILERIKLAFDLPCSAKAALSEEESHRHYCDVCRENIHAQVEAESALDVMWGTSVLDVAVLR
jgi:hypothetical protein